jgi:hypothetical protein
VIAGISLKQKPTLSSGLFVFVNAAKSVGLNSCDRSRTEINLKLKLARMRILFAVNEIKRYNGFNAQVFKSQDLGPGGIGGIRQQDHQN